MAVSLVLSGIFISLSCCLKATVGEEIPQGDDFISQSTARTLIAVIGLTICLVALIKWYFSGGVCKSKARLDGKTAIVTGANTGIGKETALDFAQRGARVILACRDEEKAKDAAKDIAAQTGSDKVVVRILDLASFQSVRAFAKLFNETEERLDILVNNAGLSGTYRLTKDGYESMFQVNYLSHFLLTLLLTEKLKKSAPSRIVNVSSLTHESKGADLHGHLEDFKPSREKCNLINRYCQSKLAQVVFTKDLSRRLEGTGVTVYALHPGGVKSDIWRFKLEYFEQTLYKTSISAVGIPLYERYQARSTDNNLLFSCRGAARNLGALLQ